MDLNSPARMILPKEIRETHAGPDALSAPDAKRRATYDASTGVSEEFVSVETEDGRILELLFRRRPKVDELLKLVYDTTAAGDFSGLDNALARDHKRDSPEYTKRFERIKEVQLSFEGQAARRGFGPKYCGKLRMKVLLNKTGHVSVASFAVIG